MVGRVKGHATSTVKHPSFEGQKLLVVQPLRSATVEPVLALDPLGSGPGSLVLISSDGKGARELAGDETSPARWTVVGIIGEDKDWPIE